MDSRLLYDSACRYLPSLTEQFRSLSPGASLIFPWVVTGTRIERLLSPSSWWDGLYTCLSSPTIPLDRGSHGVGPCSWHGAGWLAVGSTLPSGLCLHSPSAGSPSPLEAGLVQLGMEGGRLGGHGELGHRDTTEIIIGALMSWL